MTEDEAREKWCPFARIIDVDYPERTTWNRVIGTAGGKVERAGMSRCIASDCMAWRAYSEIRGGLTGQNVIREAGGYCGLAGKQ